MEATTIVEAILEVLWYAAERLPRPFETPYEHVKRLRRLERKTYTDTVSQLKRQGLISVTIKNNEKFITLTSKGQLKVLLAKACLRVLPKKWDGKWRMIIFDIPEGSRDRRAQLRNLLKNNGFFKLQSSVFINPYALNSQAIDYLYASGLNQYIRILRVDGVDKDADLRKHFGL